MATGSKKGKNGPKCKAYKNEGRQDRNKLRKLLKHARRHISDKVAAGVIASLRKSIPLATLKQDGTAG